MTRRLFGNRVSIKFKKEDIWLGVYWDSKTIYVCLIPCLPISIKRTTVCKNCDKLIKGSFEDLGYHDKCWKEKKIDDIVDEECT